MCRAVSVCAGYSYISICCISKTYVYFDFSDLRAALKVLVFSSIIILYNRSALRSTLASR